MICIRGIGQGCIFVWGIAGQVVHVAHHLKAKWRADHFQVGFKDFFISLLLGQIIQGVPLGHAQVLAHHRIEREVALEINLRTRYKQFDRTGHDPGLMDPTILLRYRDLGGELITLAGDAHSPEDFGRFFPEARAELKALGFQYGYYFQQGRPMRYAL